MSSIRMKSKLWITFAFLVCRTLTYAQSTLIDKNPQALFNKGQELYSQKQYGSAEKVFKDFLTLSHDKFLSSEAAYYIAISAVQLGQDDAETLLNDFARQYPESPRNRMMYFFLGRYQFRIRQYDKAAETLAKVDAGDLSNDDELEYNFMMGYTLFKTKKYDKAKDYFAKVKDGRDEDALLATYYYGYIAYIDGHYNEAVKEFLKVKDDKKLKNMVAEYIVQIYLVQGQYDEVIKYGDAVLQDSANTGNQEVKLYVGEAYFFKKDYAKTVALYNSYQQNGTLTPHHIYQYGYSLMANQDYAGAEKAFVQLDIKSDSLGQNIAYQLGASYLQTGDKIKARNSFEFASKLSFDKNIQEVSLLNYAKLSYELNFQKEGIEAFKAFMKNYPNSEYIGEARELLGQILLAANDPKEAIEIIESIPNRNEKLNLAYQKILYKYGFELYNDNKTDEAQGYFKKSIDNALDKKLKALAYFWLGESYYKKVNYDDALENYKNFLFISEAKYTPYYNVTNYNIGYCYFKKESYTEAYIYFEKYVREDKGNKQSPRHIDAILRCADCDFENKNYGRALSSYNSVIESNAPTADYAMYQKGMLEGLTNKSDEKIETMKELGRQFPKSSFDDDAMYEVGREYLKYDKNDEAIRAFQSLNYNYPKSPYFRASLLNIGLIYYNEQKENEAAAVFKNIIHEYPYSVEAKQALTALQNIYVERGQADSIEYIYKSLPNINFTASAQDSIVYRAAFTYVIKDDCNGIHDAMGKYLTRFSQGYYTTDAHYYLADCEYRNHDTDAAIENYNAVINKSPNEYVEKALKYSSELYYKKRDYEVAKNRYKQLEDIASNNQNTMLAITGELRSDFFIKNYDGAIETATRILAMPAVSGENKLEAQFYLAKSYLESGKLDLALSTFDEVYKHDKTVVGAEAMYQVAYIHFLQEKYKESQDIVFKLKDDYAYYDYWVAKGFILLADDYVKLNDNFQAKSTLQSILDNYTGKDELLDVAKGKMKDIQDKENQDNTNKKGDDENETH